MLQGLQVLRVQWEISAVRDKEATTVPEALLDPQDQLEYEGKWALKDHRARKELLENKERGVRKVTEVSPGSTACQEQPAPRETQGLQALLDQLDQGDLLVWWVLQERKEIWASLDRWALLEAEEQVETSEHRVLKVNPDPPALQAHLDHPPPLLTSSSPPRSTMTGTAAFQRLWTSQSTM